MGEHDTFFRHVFAHPARAAGLVRSVFPAAVVQALALDALAHVPGSFVDPELASRHADLLFRTTLRDPNGAKGADGAAAVYLYVLLEHQSEPDPLMPYRVLGYMMRIWDEHLTLERGTTLPPVLPLVVHHGERGWTVARHFHQLVPAVATHPALARHVPRFLFLVDDLVRRSDEILLARPFDRLARIALWLLRDARNDDRFAKHLARWESELARLTRDGPTEDVVAFLSYLFRVLHLDRAQHVTRRIVEVSPDTEPTMVSYAEYLENKGLAKGLAKGEATGLRLALRKQLQIRFGEIGPELVARIDAATDAEIDAALARVLTAATASDVLG